MPPAWGAAPAQFLPRCSGGTFSATLLPSLLKLVSPEPTVPLPTLFFSITLSLSNTGHVGSFVLITTMSPAAKTQPGTWLAFSKSLLNE